MSSKNAYARLLYIRRGSEQLPTWDEFENFRDEIMLSIADTLIGEHSELTPRQVRKSLGFAVRRRPSKGHIISRAISKIETRLRNEHDILIDPVRDPGDSNLRTFRLFKRQETGADVDHRQDQFLVFDKETEKIEKNLSELDDGVQVILENAIERVKTYTFWRDVRTLADQALSASNVVRTDIGYIAFPGSFELIESLTLILSLVGADVRQLKLAPDDDDNVNSLVHEALIAEFEQVFEDVDTAINELSKRQYIADRLDSLNNIRERVAVYSAALTSVQGDLLQRVEKAERMVAERLEDM